MQRQQHHHKAQAGGRDAPPSWQAGFTLIELMVGIAIVSLALMFGLPSMTAWLQSSQIRNAAESIQSGLQLAKSEAVRRNTAVQLSLSSLGGTGAPDWTVTCTTPTADCPGGGMTEIQKYSAQEGAPSARINASQDTIAFGGMGRVTPTPAATIAINITNPNGGACMADAGPMRCLRVLVSAGGHIKMCDPALPASNPRGC